MTDFLRRWKGLYDFLRCPRRLKRIVFYAETGHQWSYFEPVVDALVRDHGRDILYVTSDDDDPRLMAAKQGVRAFYIGMGGSQIAFFETLRADVVVMTTPDLHQFHIKKSRHVGCFAYLHHSMVSTHMIYREGAFDHFDAIFCVGPHHGTETLEWEQSRGLSPKKLIHHGYGVVDRLAELATPEEKPTNGRDPKVLIAPSWGENGLLETCGESLCRILLDAGFSLTVRPHPRTDLFRPDVRTGLMSAFSNNPNFSMDDGVAMRTSLIEADLMVSDWSGAALEYAFGLLRPVLFVDVPRKVNNPAYETISVPPLEVFVREGIGRVVSPETLEVAVPIAREMVGSVDTWRERIAAQRGRWLYNFGGSGQAGATSILELERACVNERAGAADEE